MRLQYSGGLEAATSGTVNMNVRVHYCEGTPQFEVILQGDGWRTCCDLSEKEARELHEEFGELLDSA